MMLVLADRTVEQASARLSAILFGSRNDASMEISITQTKILYISKKVRVSETTEDEIVSIGFKNA